MSDNEDTKLEETYEIAVYLKGGGSLAFPVKGFSVKKDKANDDQLLSIEVSEPEENHGCTLMYLDITEVAAITSRPIPREIRFLEEEERAALVKAILS